MVQAASHVPDAVRVGYAKPMRVQWQPFLRQPLPGLPPLCLILAGREDANTESRELSQSLEARPKLALLGTSTGVLEEEAVLVTAPAPQGSLCLPPFTQPELVWRAPPRTQRIPIWRFLGS